MSASVNPRLPISQRFILWLYSDILNRPLWVFRADPNMPYDKVHSIPHRDSIVHALGERCVCGPTSECHQSDQGDRWFVQHHSLDGRELNGGRRRA